MPLSTRFNKEYQEELLSRLNGWLVVVEVVKEQYGLQAVPQDILDIWQQIAACCKEASALFDNSNENTK